PIQGEDQVLTVPGRAKFLRTVGKADAPRILFKANLPGPALQQIVVTLLDAPNSAVIQIDKAEDVGREATLHILPSNGRDGIDALQLQIQNLFLYVPGYLVGASAHQLHMSQALVAQLPVQIIL